LELVSSEPISQLLKNKNKMNQQQLNLLQQLLQQQAVGGKQQEHLYNQGVGVEPSKTGSDKNMNDCHFWLVTKKGEIIDNTPPALGGKRHYKAFQPRQQKRIYKQQMHHYKFCYSKQVFKQNFQLHLKGVPRACFYNCLAYYQKHHSKKNILKIVCGSLGFQCLGDNRVFWEFG